MKKTSKLFGAVACSAALAIGCAMPAFATTPYSGAANPGVTGDGSDNAFNATANSSPMAATASTSVDVLYQAKQITAKVPLKVTIVASGSPTVAGTVLAPNASDYKITNTGLNTTNYTNFKVSGVETTVPATGEWDLVASTTSSPAKGELVLTLTGSTGGKEVVNLASAKTASQPTTWAAATQDSTSAPKDIELQLAGVSMPSGTLQSASNTGGANQVVLSADAFTIEYTIEATA